MDLRTLITPEEVDMMEYYIDTYSEYGLGCDINYILREWEFQKHNLYNILGKNLIIDKEVEFKKDTEELSREFSDKIYEAEMNHSSAYNFYKAYRDTFLTNENYREDYELFYRMDSLIDCNTLMGETWDGETFELPVPNDKSIKVQHNCKVIRTLGRIAKKFNLPDYESFRLLHSQVLNQKGLKGQLCLSIHPLDYMTMSDNNCDWSSCMSWESEGCYRQGTVEMMNSPMVVVAYLRASEDMKIHLNRWNSKKWRQLFIVNSDLIGNVKAYPYRNDNLTKEVLKWLKELCDTNVPNTYNFDEEITEYDAYNGFKHNEKTISINPRTYNMYNDFSDNQFAYLNKELDGHIEFEYSGVGECMHCGELNPDFDTECFLTGTCCYESYECASCGDRFSEDELTEIDGELYCQYCIDNYSYEDPITGCIHMEGSARRLHLIYDNGKDGYVYNDYDSIDITPGEYTPEMLKEYFNKIYVCGSYSRSNYCVKISDCTEDGLSLFGYKNSEDFIRQEKIHGQYQIVVDYNLDGANEIKDFSSDFRNSYLHSGVVRYFDFKNYKK